MSLARRDLLKMAAVAGPFLSVACLVEISARGTEPAASDPSLDRWMWFPGHALMFKTTGKETGGATTWMVAENQPRQGTPFHQHSREDEVFYVLRGTFEISVGDQTTIANPGSLVFGPRNIQHRWTNVGSGAGQLMMAFTRGNRTILPGAGYPR